MRAIYWPGHLHRGARATMGACSRRTRTPAAGRRHCSPTCTPGPVARCWTGSRPTTRTPCWR
ncbi:hypothetical protein [Ornithinimicrobium kibberense]|uniref:hypothetical protein n=1 Tax=Ornithinimicrobium kibberense TaxID=282060 RepID=UPI003607767F